MQASLDRKGYLCIPARREPYYLDGPLVLDTGATIDADREAEIRLVPGTNRRPERSRGITRFSASDRCPPPGGPTGMIPLPGSSSSRRTPTAPSTNSSSRRSASSIAREARRRDGASIRENSCESSNSSRTPTTRERFPEAVPGRATSSDGCRKSEIDPQNRFEVAGPGLRRRLSRTG
jgi:hypothetical protein